MSLKSGYGSHKEFSKIKLSFLKDFLNFIYPPMPTLNVIPKKIKKIIKSHIFNDSVVLNVGSGGLTGCGRWLWKDNDYNMNNKIINIDIEENRFIDIKGDAHYLPFKNESFDAIVMQAVIEHVRFPDLVIKESLRVLKPGGTIYLEIPFLQGFHADPYDFQRYTLQGIKVLTSDFEHSLSGVSVGPFCTLIWILRDGLSSCFKNKYLFLTSRFLLAWILSPIRYLDFFVRNLDSSERLANEYYYLCKKPKI